MGSGNISRALFLLLTVLNLSQCDYWGEWSAWSECSRTCDGGATYQERKCIRSYHSREGCEGDRYNYDTCNTNSCLPDVIDFRLEQCTAYNNATYGGKLYDWLPYTDRKNPCALYCIAKGTRTVVRLAPKVLDGTRCRSNDFDMCISGKCWKVGCDYKLGSSMQPDLCGVCGGNNSCLTSTQPQKGRYQWREAGLSQCSASCGVGEQVSVFSCTDIGTGRQVNDKHCQKSSRPAEKQQSCFRRRCPPAWKIFPWQPCSVTCGGGVASRAVRCMDTLRDGRQQWLHDSFCPSPHPSTVQSCNRQICPTWYAGQWSPCSVTCGWGSQVREVVCRHEGDTFCEEDTKPVTKRNCTTNFPCFDPDDSRYIAEQDESDNALRQESSLGEMREETNSSLGDVTLVIHESEVSKHDVRSPRFIVSSWSDCSVSCDIGVRERLVNCRVYLVYLRTFVHLSDKDCEGEKPPSRETCMLETCYSDYEWRAIGMTPCDQSCLGGTQETLVHCVHKEKNTEATEDHCKMATPVPIERKICNDISCPQRWRIGDFGSCTFTCGGGLMFREVTCIQEVNRVIDNIVTLPDVMCQVPVPMRVRVCNTQFCPANWAIGFWSECSVTCGPGVKLRPVVCQRPSSDGIPMDVDEYNCPPTEKPQAEQPCDLGKCPTIQIKQQSMRFFQLNKMDKVRLTVGAVAALLPGTSVVASCPVRGMSKNRIEWLKNDRPLRKSRRSYVSNNGKLRISDSRPERDTGNYTCLAGPARADLEIVFSDLFAVVQETVLRERYLLDFLADNPSENVSAYHKDPFDRQARALQVVVGDWSDCSASCDGGFQTRFVSCEIITKDYFEAFSLRTCRKAGLYVPPTHKKCGVEPCVKWTVGEWKACSVDSCTEEGKSTQNRSVRCTVERNASYVSDSLCDVTQKPKVTQLCENQLCRPVWNTSEWSVCSADCGKEGVEMRILLCIWEHTGLPAGSNCRGLARPLLVRNCKRDDCQHSCKDESAYCSAVKMMKLCKNPTFRQKCCKSCQQGNTSNTS